MTIEDFSNTKKDIASIIFIVILVSLAFFLVSCNPCRQVAKHPECFPADTVKQIEYKTKYVKEYITNDSIIYQTEPCDPKDSLVYRTKIEYRTKNITEIDTIYSDKEVIKVNPLNEQLKNDNDKLTNKLENRTRLALYLSIALIVLALFMWLKSKL